ncbi:MAG: phage tail tape measure protein [Candidatus Limnocylindrales bacterium]
MSIQAASLFALVSVSGAKQSVSDLQSVSNQVGRTQSTLSKLAGNAGQVGHGMLQVGQGLLRVGEIAAVAAGTAAVAAAKMTMTFQQQMELIHTQAGASQAEVATQTAAIEGMVHSVGTTPTELATGLYHIESAGVRGAAAIDILRASALGAKTGLANMESVSNALVAVWFSGVGGAKDMASAMGILNGIVGVGNMRMQDLVDSFSTGILGTAKTFGVGLRELGSALAVLTDAGVPAQIAATRLSMTFSHMAAPVPGAIKVLQHLGLAQFSLAKDLRAPDGIFVAFQDLHDHLVKVGELKGGILTPQGTADVTKIFGGSRFGATAMQLLGQMDRIKLKYDAIGVSQQNFGDQVAATMQTAGFKFSQLKADIENDALAFGQGFLPALARAGSALDSFVVGQQGNLATLGVQVGAWIDKIDWKQVEDGASTFVSILRTVVEVIGKIPVQIDAAIAGFLVLNKLSGGLVGKGLGNIGGGLLKMAGNILSVPLRALLSRIPVIGGAAAAATVMHVWVDNMPAGFGSGGPNLPNGLKNAGEGAAGAAGIGLSSLLAAAAVALTPVLAAELVLLLSDPKVAAAQDLAYRRQTAAARGLNPAAVPAVVPDGRRSPWAAFLAAGPTSGGLSPEDRTQRAIDNAAAQAHGDALAGTDAQILALGVLRQIDLHERALHQQAKLAVGGPSDSGLSSFLTKFRSDGAFAVKNFGKELRYLLTASPVSKASPMWSNVVKEDLSAMVKLQRDALSAKDWGLAAKLGADIAELKAQQVTSASAMVSAEARAAAAMSRASITANINLQLPAAQSYAQVIHVVHRYGPTVI